MDTLNTPSYISPRSANSLISFSRPTRIQFDTLEYLNKILDELLLLILTSAKSLATDRIKSEGILRVLGGQSGSGSGAGALLAKNAVLEAELELRSFLDGQRKEGGKMPLGLSATSRWDGTEGFPVQSAYKALRVRCQYYSTLGDLDDPSPHSPQDQNIMSADGRPIATLTPGVAIYVTALLEFVGEYILQNVARVMERDNSDEAAVKDLVKAMDEDEGTSFWWSKMKIRKEITAQLGGKLGQGKVQKPWQVPDASELDQAAGKKKSHRQSVGMNTGAAGKASHDRDISASSPYNDRTASSLSGGGGGATSPTPSTTNYTSIPASTSSGSTAEHGTGLNNNSTLKRRPSTDRGAWFLGKRRGSFRSSQDLSSALGMATNAERNVSGGRPGTAASSSSSALTPRDINGNSNDRSGNADGGDSFDSLVMSGQTMKVSLTPNRLRSLDASTDRNGDDTVRNYRRRPGTGVSSLRADESRATSRTSTPVAQGEVNNNGLSESAENAQDGRLSSSAARSASSRGMAKGVPPPSSYRGFETDSRPPHVSTPDVAQRAGAFPASTTTNEDDDEEEAQSPLPSLPSTGSARALVARDEKRRSMSVRDMVDMINNTSPPSPKTAVDGAYSTMSNGRESRMSVVSQASTETSVRRMTLSAASGRVLGLFGRKSSVTPASPNPSISTTASRAFSSTDHRPSLTNSFVGGEETHDVGQPRRVGPVDRFDTGTGKPLPAPSLDITESPQDTSLERTPKDGVWSTDSAEFTPAVAAAMATRDSKPDERPASALAGQLYQQPRANGSASTLSSTAAIGSAGTATAASRKPWAYNRQASGGSRRASGPLASAARIGSGSSNQSHGGEQQGTTNAGVAPPSAWSQTSFAIVDTDATTGTTPETSVRTPIVGVSPTFGRTSPSPRPFGSSKADTARLLVQLNQRMRDCISVEECQRLVMQALAVAAAAVHSSEPDNTDGGGGSAAASPMALRRSISSASGVRRASHDDAKRRPNGVGEREPVSVASVATPAASLLRDSAAEVPSVPLLRPIKYRNLALPMAVGYEASEDDSLALFKHQSVVASWLLDNEGDEPDVTLAAAIPATIAPSATSETIVGDFATSAAGEPTKDAVADDISTYGFDMMTHVHTAAAQPKNGVKQRIASIAGKDGVNGGVYQMPQASDSGTAAAFVDDDEERRISTVSSNFSTYRDAEEGGPVFDDHGVQLS